MKKLLLLVSLIFSINISHSQSSADAAVQLTAVVQSSPPSITLGWLTNTTTSQYQVFRKLKTASVWGTPLAALQGTASQYIDNTVLTNTEYEYRIIRTGSGYTGFGYISSAIELKETEYRGKLLLLVDSTMAAPLSSEINRLITDIEGDGWEVTRHDVLRTGSVTHVKSIIVDHYNTDPLNVKCVFILGHVPVPYSGNINPDGHTDHQGAWPADVYYGEMDGTWTDVNGPGTSTNSPARTQNYPGDGKFDQSLVPGNVELQVGRVDLSGLTSFTLTETQLLKNYLDKDHDYRKKVFSPVRRAVIDDNFGYFGSEAFAASGYKNFAPLAGTANIVAADYFTTLGAGSYLWAYGCGGGTYNSAGGIGTTANFAASNLQGVFSMLFGSYFGDWDSQDNFLKAPLAQGKCLTNVWSGRPHYQFHHMGLGENIGYSLLITQNNPGLVYYNSPTGINGKWIHNALMGDPTLRNDVVSPVSNVVAAKSGFDCHISWSASTETNIAGYNIYMKNDTNKTFVKLNASPLSGTTYTDVCLVHKGVYTYMVRALKLEVVDCGSYYNMSEGLSDTSLNTTDFTKLADFTVSTNGNTVTVIPTSTAAQTYQWEFGNGGTSTLTSPSFTYDSNGSYVITLVAGNACASDTSYITVNITGVGIDELNNEGLIIFPNPSGGLLNIAGNDQVKKIDLYDCGGRKVLSEELTNGVLDLSQLPRGIYCVSIEYGKEKILKKIVLE